MIEILTQMKNSKRTQSVWTLFSSRRRHTRFDCDWSSDVCSSDLWVAIATTARVDVDYALTWLCGQQSVLDVMVFLTVDMSMDQAAELGLEQNILRPCRTGGRQLPALTETDHGHGVLQRLELQASTRATAEFTGATTVGHQAVAVNQYRIGVLKQFDIAGHQRAEAAQRAASRPTIHSLVSASAGDERGQHHGHIFIVVLAWVVPSDIDPAGMPPGGGHTLRSRLFKGQTHGIGEGFHRSSGAVDVRCRLLGVAQSTGRAKVYTHAAIEAFIVGRWHLCEHHQSEVNPGDRIARVGVDDGRHLRRALYQNVRLVAANFHLGSDRQFSQTMTGVFENGSAAVETVWHITQQCAHMTVCHIFQLGNARSDLVDAIAIEQLDQVTLAHAASTVLGIQIAFLIGAGAHVGQQQVDYVFPALALGPQLD